eukprot:3940356-Rhodomonas_salina.2
MCGIELAYAAMRCAELSWRTPLLSYAIFRTELAYAAMRCPILAYGTELAYGSTSRQAVLAAVT